MDIKKLRKYLLFRLIFALILGIIIGFVSKDLLKNEVIVRLLASFNDLFGTFLGFSIPLIIIGLIIPGISDLGKGAGKALAIITTIAYCSTIFSGSLAFFVNNMLFKTFLKPGSLVLSATNASETLLKGYITFSLPPVMSVTTALIFSFLLGIGLASLNKQDSSLKAGFKDFQEIISKLIQNVIVPLLPLHIMGIFSNITYSGTVFNILSIFIKVFGIIIILHFSIIFIQYFIAGIITKKSPIVLIKNMVPSYFTAIGTQSSAATIPITLEQTKKNGVSDEVADFAIPLCATIHMSGSTITLVSCSMAILILNGMNSSFSVMFPFILALGVTIVAAPGAPGGGVIAALGILQSILGFNEAMSSLIIALYVAQDSFGTACNVTGDGAIAMIMDHILNRKKTTK